MRSLFALIVLALQAADLPPAYPRPGTTKIFENDRAVAWNISWLKQTYPLHRHRYDLVGIYYTDGDRIIVSTEGNRRPVSTKAWDSAFQLKGVTHVEEGASDQPLRAVFLELKEDAARNRPVQPGDDAFPKTQVRQIYDNERVLAWELKPGATAPHRHLRDTIIMAFTGTTPKITAVPAGTRHADEATGTAEHVYAFELK